MRIAVLLDEQFPDGMASANRALLYSKGLTELGNDTVIFVPRATEHQGKIRNHSAKGIYEGVRYRYAYEPVIRKSFLGRRFQNSISLLNSFLFFFRFKPDIIIIAANNFSYILLGKICSILVNARLVREKSEVPYYRLEKLSPRDRTRIKAEFRLFDGMIAISGALKDFFQKDLGLELKIIEVPILIDCSILSLNENGHPVKKTNLVYTGSLRDHKDGVITIIKAFGRLLENHPDLKLVMTGDLNGSVSKTEILDQINSLKLNDKVELPGYLPREELKELTASAVALLLAKPRNRQNSYNMATKVGEYLLTGRPVVISSVDPVCGYLKHRESACITEPDEIRMAEEIEFLLDNAGKADAIGLAGRQSVQKQFDYRIHAQRMNDFFKVLIRSRQQ
jgi:glycosyltransferase involved in cell wall biosynthesis